MGDTHAFLPFALDITIFTATKLRNFSDIKLGISIPARGETNDLLIADGDKNDYDWCVVFLSFEFSLLNHVCVIWSNLMILILTVCDCVSFT